MKKERNEQESEDITDPQNETGKYEDEEEEEVSFANAQGLYLT